MLTIGRICGAMQLKDYFQPFAHLLIHEPGKVEPLAYVENGYWLGRKEWKTKHGPAICTWMLYRPISITDALLPDGKRGNVQNIWTSKGWRRQDPAKGYIWGKVDISESDAIFNDHQEDFKRAFITEILGSPNLEADLRESEMMLQLIQDDRYAFALNFCFYNTNFIHEQSGQTWKCSMRQAGAIVAELRGLGESYLDFYSTPSPYGRDDKAHREVLMALQMLGWSPCPS